VSRVGWRADTRSQWTRNVNCKRALAHPETLFDAGTHRSGLIRIADRLGKPPEAGRLGRIK
jgi:hypothetical protein